MYDGDRLIAEYNTAGTVQRRYVHGAAVDEPLVWYEGSAVSAAIRRYLHANHQGSIIATSNAAGTKLDLGTYDAYGVTTAPSTWRFQYTGQAAIPQLGLYYYKARFYNPALGRFMQTDPIGYDDDVNLYAYVGSDPLNRTDPTGEYYQLIGAAISVIGYYASTDNPTSAGAAVAIVSGAFGGGTIRYMAQLGKTGLTLMTSKSTITTVINAKPVALPISQAAGEIGQVAGAMTGGAAVAGGTHVATNIADAAATGQLSELTHPLAGADKAALAGAVAGPADAAGAPGAAATSGRVSGILGRVGTAISSGSIPAARGAASEAVQQAVQSAPNAEGCNIRDKSCP